MTKGSALQKHCAWITNECMKPKYELPVFLLPMVPEYFRMTGQVVSNFIVQALRGEALTIYGDGKQTRSFCYVDDLAEGLIRLMNSDYTNPVNIGNPNEFTMLQLAVLVKNKIDPSLPITHKDLPEDDPMQRQPIIEVAKKTIRLATNR